MASKYRIELTDDVEKWYEICSPYETFTIFSDPDFLKAFNEEKVFGYVYKGNEIKAGFTFTVKNNKCKRPTLVIHNGTILFNNEREKRVRSILNKFYINEALVEFLEKELSSIDLSLHPYIKDIRPFLWLNYHSFREEDKCRIFVRYTSYLNIVDLAKTSNEFKTETFRNMLEIRKRNVKEAKRLGVVTKRKMDVDLFIRFYTEMMKKQGIEPRVETIEGMEKVTKNMYAENKLEMFVSYYKEEPIYITIWGWDKNRAYYLYGAGNPSITSKI